MNKNLKDEYTFLLEKLTINLISQLEWRENQNKLKQNNRKGVVYVINQVGTNNYKIGISTNYQERFKHFSVKLPFDIQETAVYETDEFITLEKQLHEYFADKRLNNSEFFELNQEDLEQIPKIINGETDDSQSDDTDTVEEAKKAIIEYGKASTSFLQRKLRIGYARASRVMDLLEEEGFIGESNGARPREILVNSDNHIPPLTTP